MDILLQWKFLVSRRHESTRVAVHNGQEWILEGPKSVTESWCLVKEDSVLLCDTHSVDTPIHCILGVYGTTTPNVLAVV